MTEKLNGLLAYLDRLERLNNGSYNCTKEIGECVVAIRTELSIGSTKPFVYTPEMLAVEGE